MSINGKTVLDSLVHTKSYFILKSKMWLNLLALFSHAISHIMNS